MRIQDLIRSNVNDLVPYSSARDEFQTSGTGMVFLDANENPFDNGLNRYPDPWQLEVKKVLADIKGVRPETILLGNGSDEVLDLIFRVFCEPGTDKVITLPPTYGMYEVLARINAVDVVQVPLGSDFQPQAEAILEAADQTCKLLFLCTPNNPTGNSFNPQIVERLIREFSGIVVIDEAYADFSRQASWTKRLDEFPNLIVIQTLSKAYGMAGIRLGSCYASEDIIAVLNKIKPPYNVNELTQQRALSALNKQELVKVQVESILQERDALGEKIKDLSIVKQVLPSDANFLLVRVDDANRRYQQLIDKGIVVRNRTNQPLCENCLRFTIGTPGEMDQLLTVLKQLQ